MRTFDLDRLSGLVGLLTTLAVAVPVVLAHLGGDAVGVVGRPVLWWAAYLLFLAAFVPLSTETVAEQLTPLLRRVLVAVMAVTGMATYVIAPGYGFTVVLMIVTSVSVAFMLGARAALALSLVQVAVVGISLRAVGASTTEAVLQGVVFFGFMAFAIVTVESAMREIEARTTLAEANEALADSNARLERANADLEASRRLLAESSRNAERLRISRDLHDLIGHQLTALTLHLEAASHQATGPAATHVERSRTIARDLLADVREVVGQLRHAPADLEEALGTIAASVDRPRVEVTVGAGSDRADTGTLVRLVRELVTNAARHSDADHLWIDVTTTDGTTFVRARDDGCGTAVVVPGNGLTGMRERIEDAGGRLTITSHPGQGFDVEAVLPVPEEAS